MSEPTPARPTRGIVVSAVVIVVLGLLIAWDKGRDDRPHASVGDLLQAADTLADAHDSSVLLPTGRLNIRATRALEDVDGDAAVRAKQAPEDGNFVGLQLTAVPLVGDATLATPYSSLAVTVTLIADGRRYTVVGDNATGNRQPPVPLRRYVAVAGTPSRLVLEVGYETRKQQVDLRSGRRTPGVFADLYRTTTRTSYCGAPGYSPAGVAPTGRAPTCRVELVARTPYYRSLRWAPAGKAWLVARVVTRSADGVRYSVPGSAPAGYKLRSTGILSYGWNGRQAVYGATSKDDFGTVQANVVVVPVPSTGSANGVLTVTVEQRPALREDSRRSSAPALEQAITTWRVRL